MVEVIPLILTSIFGYQGKTTMSRSNELFDCTPDCCKETKAGRWPAGLKLLLAFAPGIAWSRQHCQQPGFLMWTNPDKIGCLFDHARFHK